jgi:hypothetical protein
MGRGHQARAQQYPTGKNILHSAEKEDHCSGGDNRWLPVVEGYRGCEEMIGYKPVPGAVSWLDVLGELVLVIFFCLIMYMWVSTI